MLVDDDRVRTEVKGGRPLAGLKDAVTPAGCPDENSWTVCGVALPTRPTFKLIDALSPAVIEVGLPPVT